MALQDLRSDLATALEQITAASGSSLDLKATLIDTVFPLLAGVIDEMVNAEASVADLGSAVDELINQDEDILHPETAQQISGVLAAGLLLATEVEKLKGVDEVTKKKLGKLILAYRAGVQTVEQIIAEITIPLDELDGADPDSEDEDGIAAAQGRAAIDDDDEGDDEPFDDDAEAE